MSIRSFPLLALLAAPFALTACSSGEPEDINPEELITRVELTLTNEEDLGDSITITASDPDGNGEDFSFAPASVTLRPGAIYVGSIELTDTINNEDITEEVEEEAEAHLFSYTFDPASAGTITLTDVESDYTTENNNGGDFAVGLDFQVAVASTASGAGKLVALLYHFDDAPKMSNTDTGEIDVDIEFPVSFAAPVTREVQ